MRKVFAFLIFVLGFNGLAAAQEVIPERRVILWRNIDFFGSDIQTILDASLGACENACLADSSCRAYTFNSNKNVCFLKNGI
ncbi:MAG: PAN/Apple domain-containing protein, partial [Mariprofundaceae bacterium]|nr:PAN/Apple domain-containing protein [Mariprofundaceae bacterium]